MQKQFSLFRFLLLSVMLLLTNTLFAVHRVFVLHPTVGNIENMVQLVRLKVIVIPDLEFVGVYHEKEAYDYNESEKYLKEKKIPHFTLMKITGALDVKNIYGENACTPAFRKIVEEADALLFNGGPDIQPAIYGEKQHLLTMVTDPNRHLMETSLLFQLLGGSRNPGFKPLLQQKPNLIIRGFCLGMQSMNVAAGGTLIQDIPVEVYHISTAEGMLTIDAVDRHHNYHNELNPGCDLSWALLHPVRLAARGYLHDLCLGMEQQLPWVLSSHHQAAGKLGQDLEVIATSMDGKIVEGLQHKIFREVVGVQFHPEQASLYQPESKMSDTPDRIYSPNEQLNREKSIAFHRKFWQDFSAKVMRK